jgi:hypothetical protein
MKKIPNFNTLSTLLDRLSIENVKLSHFENAIEYDDLSTDKALEYKYKIKTQKDIIDMLKDETTKFMTETFIGGEYNYVKEERTFD